MKYVNTYLQENKVRGKADRAKITGTIQKPRQLSRLKKEI